MALTKAHHRMIAGSVYNVQDYGATGDGTTDDSTAIQAAVDAASAAGGGIVYFPKPSSNYNIGSTTIVLKGQVQMHGEGRESTQISGSSDVFQLGNPTSGPAFNCSIRDLKLTTTDATKACVLVSGGSAAGDTPSGELNASQVKFDGDNAWRFDTANFFYSGFWEIDGCIFKKYTHFSTTQALNDQGSGMLVNTVRITKCTWNTTGSGTTDWACKISDTNNYMTTRNFTIDECVFERSDGGGIIIYGGTGFNIKGAWFYDLTSSTTVVQIQDSVGQVTLQNVFGRPVGYTAKIVNRSESGVVMINTNVDSIDNVTAQTSSSLPRVLHMFTNEDAATLFETTFSSKGTFISSPAPAGLQAMTMTIPATTGTGTIAVPVSSLYDHTLFSRIVGFSFRMGSAGTSDPGATYDWGIRLRDSTNGTLSSWTNANTAVAAYETIDAEISGVMDGSDFTDWITTVAQNNLYIDVVKNGSGNTVNQFEATIYVM